VNVTSGTATNATAGVTQVGTAVTDATYKTESTVWKFPVDITACAIQVSVVSTGGYYSFYPGGGAVGAGPSIQATRTDAHTLFVISVWPGGAGVNFSLLVTCP